ncbi:MAG: matrixin family metalloprotease [Candidatus Kariarchaeaceae archaeon]
MDNVRVVCEYSFKDPSSPHRSDNIEITEFPRQRGIWNKNVVTWWITGDVLDGEFSEREAFLRRCFNIAFTEWDLEIPVSFVQASSEDAADITIEFGSKVNDPHYKDSPAVLAYAGFPDGSLKGYIKFFTDWSWNAHGEHGYNIIIVAMHELGHTIGLSHSNKQIPEDLMAPIYSRHHTEASEYDIARATSAYGVRVYDHPSHHARLATAHTRSKERIRNQEITNS